jgi:hypothetical protein
VLAAVEPGEPTPPFMLQERSRWRCILPEAVRSARPIGLVHVAGMNGFVSAIPATSELDGDVFYLQNAAGGNATARMSPRDDCHPPTRLNVDVIIVGHAACRR